MASRRSVFFCQQAKQQNKQKKEVVQTLSSVIVGVSGVLKSDYAKLCQAMQSYASAGVTRFPPQLRKLRLNLANSTDAKRMDRHWVKLPTDRQQNKTRQLNL